MTVQTWGDIYGGSGGDRQSVPGGVYHVQITETRPYQGKMLFLDLGVLSGPEQGKTAQVNLFVPGPGEKGSFYFQKKIAGMLAGPPAGFVEAFQVGDRDRALDVLAAALEGQSCIAELSVRADGDYAGSNELEGTKPADVPAAVPLPQAPAPAPAPIPVPVPQSVIPAPAVQPVAAAPVQPVAPAPAPALAPAPDEVPF